MIFKQMSKKEFGGRLIDIGLESVAVAAGAWSSDLHAVVLRGVKNVAYLATYLGHLGGFARLRSNRTATALYR